jgi:hydroxymethylpyrimidine/phosphomethylpyrimidine kinase
MIPIAVTIAGSDSSGGAGIQADLKTFSACKVYGASIIAALTAQNTCCVSAIHAVPPDFVNAQMDAVYSDLDVRATKIGMLANADLIRVVAEGLERHRMRWVVLDPVMVAASGAALLDGNAVNVLQQELMPKATLITPNLAEAAVLLACGTARSIRDMRDQAEALRVKGAHAVLIKGGHGTGENSVDVLLDERGCVEFSAPRIETHNTHGTGCTLSSAIAAYLALGMDLRSSVQLAKDYVTCAIKRADLLNVGHGHGPLWHF